jgi:hypothetical protein
MVVGLEFKKIRLYLLNSYEENIVYVDIDLKIKIEMYHY